MITSANESTQSGMNVSAQTFGITLCVCLLVVFLGWCIFADIQAKRHHRDTDHSNLIPTRGARSHGSPRRR